MRKIGIVTGTRAEYGLLKPVMQKIKNDSQLELCIIATGTHLEKKFGFTYREIEKDGFKIDYKVDMQLTSDTAFGVCRSMGIELMELAKIFREEKLDIIVLLGDRYEIEMVAVAALIYRIPIAHIHGGELTEGLIDDAIRHSITKMSDIHFTSTQEYAKRVIQMGEQPKRVFYVGALGTENIKNMILLDRDQLCERFGDIFRKPYVMVTYHPVTLEECTAKSQFENLINVINNHKEYNYIFTYANADPDGNVINELIEKYVSENCNTKAVVSMGQLGYLSALKYCRGVLGNSSSGIIEAPSFHIPTINIGDRQKGRVKAKSIVDCGTTVSEIEKAFEKVEDKDFLEFCKQCDNPYEKQETSKTIVKVIKKFLEEYTDKKKKFYDIEGIY